VDASCVLKPFGDGAVLFNGEGKNSYFKMGFMAWLKKITTEDTEFHRGFHRGLLNLRFII